VLRKRGKDRQFVLTDQESESESESAEVSVLLSEEHEAVLAAMRRLPGRQREAVALRYCLDMPTDEVARAMGISQGAVKSATSRGIAALGRMLREDS
jgi:RNA polymerase sigma factor (sigma-70 family)